MVTTTSNVRTVPLATEPAAAAGAGLSRVSWGAIFAGAVVALAAMLLLTFLGVGMGAASIDPLTENHPVSGLGTGSAIYLVIAQLIALGVGGWVAARLAGVPRKTAGMLHGAAVWAVASLAMLWFATTAVGSLVSGGASLVASAASGAARAAAAVIPDDLQLPTPSVSDIDMNDLPPQIRQALRRQGITRENFKTEARQMFRSVLSKKEQATATDAVIGTARDIIANPSDAGAEIDQLIDKLFGGPQAVLSEEDRKQAVAVMQNRLGLSPEEAQKLYDRWVGRAKEAAAEVQAAVADAKKRSLEAASTAASAVSKLGFAAFFASLLSLIAAVGAAWAGRPKELIGARASDYSSRG